MKKSEKEIIKNELNEALKEWITSMSEKYPGYDIEQCITKNLIEKRGSSIRQSEVDYFKGIAISSLGKENSISFDDAERGFLKAALADGKNGFKEFIESIPIESPTNKDGNARNSAQIAIISSNSGKLTVSYQ